MNFRFVLLLLLLGGFFPQAHAQASSPGLTDQQLLAAIDRVPAPPKTVDDLIKALDAAKPNIEVIQKNTEIADSQPSEGLSQLELWNFYRRRVAAAEELGRIQQMKADCLKTIEFAPRSSQNAVNDSRMSCIQADFNDGNPLGAIEKIKAMLATNPSWGWSLSLQMLLVNAYRLVGDLESAEKALRDVDGTLVLLRRIPAWAEWGTHWTLNAERARGEFFLASGKAVAAELAFARALAESTKWLEAIDRGTFKNSNQVAHSKEKNIFGRAILLQRMGQSLFNQRKLAEAEYYFRSALKTYLSVIPKNTVHVSGVLSFLANCIAEQGRVEESLLLARYSLQAIQESTVSKDSWAILVNRRGLAAALVNAEKFDEATEQFKIIRTALESDAQMRTRVRRVNDLDEVVARIRTNDAPFAETIARDMYQTFLKAEGAKHPRTAWTQAFMGVALETQGKTAEARKAFEVSIPLLVDQARNDSENQTLSLKAQKRFNIVIESYIDALFAEARENPAAAQASIAQAFQLADMARGSAVQRALTQSTARSNIKDKRLETLARKEQDLQRRINSLNELLVALSAAPPERQLPAVQNKMRADIESLKAERESVKKEIERRFPEYFDLVEPKPITVARTAKILKPDEVLITWYFGERKSYVWAIHAAGLHSYAALSLTKADVARDVERLRKALDPGVSTVDEVPPFDVALANRFYNQLIKPVEASLAGKKLLISIPHASLGQLPISTFVTEPGRQPGAGAGAFGDYRSVQWLARKIAIAQLPSVNALAALRADQQRRLSGPPTFIAFADPYFSLEQQKKAAAPATAPVLVAANTQLATRGRPLHLRSAPKTSKVSSAELALLPGLPDTSLEVKEIGQALGAKPEDIHLHEKASVRQVMQTDFSNKSVVMFATHGLVPGELDGLTQPALALSSPEVTGEKDSDGLLTMDKILELKLNADWVVLSACNTASSDGNAEALSGLGRAFFYAGARALLVSNWPVDTVASRQLMTDLFKRQTSSSGISKSEALRQAMVELIDRGEYRELGVSDANYSYAHPLFWAPFVLVGD
jgi:CHAT domain-containing protein